MGIEERVWTRDRARREGVSRARLVGGLEFVRVVPGAYLEACWAEDHLSRCAAVAHAAPGGLLSHWSALSAHGLPVPAGQDVHLTVPLAGPRPRWPGVVAHRSAVLHPHAAGGLPVTGAVRAWCDAAATVDRGRPPGRSPRPDLADLVAAGDALLARRPGMSTDVGNLLTLRPACRGVVVVRRALSMLDPRSESAQESRLRVVLVLGGLPVPAVQHEVRDDQGRFVARVDLAYVQARVAVEYDGDHHRDRAQWRRDLGRRERLEAMGWRVVVVVAADLRGAPQAVVARVRSAVADQRREWSTMTGTRRPVGHR